VKMPISFSFSASRTRAPTPSTDRPSRATDPDPARHRHGARAGRLSRRHPRSHREITSAGQSPVGRHPAPREAAVLRPSRGGVFVASTAPGASGRQRQPMRQNIRVRTERRAR
jgi:hypothetical protein